MVSGTTRVPKNWSLQFKPKPFRSNHWRSYMTRFAVAVTLLFCIGVATRADTTASTCSARASR